MALRPVPAAAEANAAHMDIGVFFCLGFIEKKQHRSLCGCTDVVFSDVCAHFAKDAVHGGFGVLPQGEAPALALIGHRFVAVGEHHREHKTSPRLPMLKPCLVFNLHGRFRCHRALIPYGEFADKRLQGRDFQGILLGIHLGEEGHTECEKRGGQGRARNLKLVSHIVVHF